MIIFKNKTLYLLFVILILAIACRPSKTKLKEYQNTIISVVNNVVEAEDSLINNLKKDSIVIYSIFKHFNNQIDSSIIAIKSIKSIEKETSFRFTAIDVLNSFKNYANKDYKELIELIILPDEYYTAEKDRRFNFLLKTIDNRLNKEMDKLFKSKQMFDNYYFSSKND